MEDGPPDFSADYTCPQILWMKTGRFRFAYETFTLSCPVFQPVLLAFAPLRLSVTPPVFLPAVWPTPVSLATTPGISFDFFSSAYLDVSVRQVPLLNLFIQLRIRGSSPRGFPHSDICGSGLISSSPQLFAGNRVLLRLSVPRHSPYALVRLNGLAVLFSKRKLLVLLESSQIIVGSF